METWQVLNRSANADGDPAEDGTREVSKQLVAA
jgi:hypothetical protein